MSIERLKFRGRKTVQFTDLPVDEIKCRRCSTELSRRDLAVSFDVEYGHPLNKGKRMDDENLHVTRFEACPFCGTTIFADGKPIGG